MTLGVLLVDEIPLFRDGLCATVHRTPGLRWMGATRNVQAAKDFVQRSAPEVILIDAVLDPRCALIKVLTTMAPRLTVISLVREPLRTTRFIAETVAAGAHGVLLRSTEPAHLVEAIRRAHLERRYIDPGLHVVAPGIGHAPRGARQPLSRRENEVLRLIAEGLENQAIAGMLYVSTETVRTHVKSILRKLHARDRTHAVAIAFRLGVFGTSAEDAVRAVS